MSIAAQTPAPLGSVLMIDDDVDFCELVKWSLAQSGLEVSWRTRADEALQLVVTQDFDCIVTDLQMTGMNGIDLSERILGVTPEVPVVIVTAYGSLHWAVAAIRVGAYDFITKPADMEMLALTVARAVQHRHLRQEVVRLREAVAGTEHFERLVGGSPAMRQLYTLIDQVARTDAAVLITGPSGTGKELVAHAIHDRGSRRGGPFVAINCAAVPFDLLESELFGHARGAFTDARTERVGLFVEANRGTLFLDEIGELPLAMQAKLLRALQERTVRPVGKNLEVPFDARIIAATNRDLEADVHEHRFREDLYYRINVVPVEVPALRVRGGDLLLLAQHFVRRFALRHGKNVRNISQAAAEKLFAYPWPGNVRELENCIERAVALTRFDHLTVEDLPVRLRAYRSDQIVISADTDSELVTLEELERRYIDRVLTLVGGNKSRAARILGLDRRTLYRKLGRQDEPGAESP